jgi:hypothetical protein
MYEYTKKKNQVERLLALMDSEALTRDEFVKNFKQVLDFVVKIKEQNGKDFETMKEQINSAIETLKEDNGSDISEVKKMCTEMMDKMMTEHEKKMKAMDDKMDSITQPENGMDADEEKVMEMVLAKIPPAKELQPETPEIIRDKLESLTGEERLDKSAIKGLEERILELEAKITSSKGGMRGMRKIPIVKRYRLTDQCNGVLKSFVLPKDTVDVLGVFGTQFPINYDPYNTGGGDWSLTGNTLTLGSGVSAPETGQTLWCLLETLFY